MATRSAKRPKRRPVTLQVCIDELQLIQSLVEDTKGKDPRIPGLVDNARQDILDALDAIHKGDDLPEEKILPPPG